MILQFTEEEKSFIASIQKKTENGKEVKRGRISCIREISFHMAGANTPEMLLFLGRTERRLGWMTDQEYEDYDFSVDEEEPEYEGAH